MIMVTNALQIRPNSAAEELRFESAQRAAQLFDRARLMRNVVACSAFVLLLARVAAPTLFGSLSETVFSLPAVVAYAALAMLITFANVWTSRMFRDECFERYTRYVGSHRAT
jgi:hypothetical protein